MRFIQGNAMPSIAARCNQCNKKIKIPKPSEDVVSSVAYCSLECYDEYLAANNNVEVYVSAMVHGKSLFVARKIH